MNALIYQVFTFKKNLLDFIKNYIKLMNVTESFIDEFIVICAKRAVTGI